MKNNDLRGHIIQEDTMLKEEIHKNVKEVFRKMFPSYYSAIPEETIQYAVQDVLCCSAVADEEYYNDDDISLACQRAILTKLGANI